VSDLIEIKAKTKTGVIQTFQVSEIIEIDGKPYRSCDQYQEMRDQIIHLGGRLSAIEAFIGNKE
jgi:hypothetical protein